MCDVNSMWLICIRLFFIWWTVTGCAPHGSLSAPWWTVKCNSVLLRPQPCWPLGRLYSHNENLFKHETEAHGGTRADHNCLHLVVLNVCFVGEGSGQSEQERNRRGGSCFWLLLLFQSLFISDGDWIPWSPHTASFVVSLLLFFPALALFLPWYPFLLHLFLFLLIFSFFKFLRKWLY